MDKVPYNDKRYLEIVSALGSLAEELVGMEGSDRSTLEDVFDNILDNLEEAEQD